MDKIPGLVVFVKAQQPRNPSSVVNRKDRSVRQKQEPTRYDSARARTKIYLQPCLEHDPATMVTVQAYVRYFAADIAKNIDMGIAEICFFCREIVTEPSNGWYSPSEAELKDLTVIYKQRSEEQKTRYANRKKKSVGDADEVSTKKKSRVLAAKEVVLEPEEWSEGSPDVEWLD